jgi:uncharacterized membrane protein YhaH (DUF805 family)
LVYSSSEEVCGVQWTCGTHRILDVFLFNFIFSLAASLIGVLTFGILYIVAIVYGIAVFVPALAVGVRRLHDVGKSGWYYFIVLIPIAGPIWFLVLMCTDSQPGDNQYGPNPKEQQLAPPAQSADA